jgi:hypothetical protein
MVMRCDCQFKDRFGIDNGTFDWAGWKVRKWRNVPVRKLGAALVFDDPCQR